MSWWIQSCQTPGKKIQSAAHKSPICSNLIKVAFERCRSQSNPWRMTPLPLSSFVHSRLASTDRSELNFPGPWDSMDLLDFTELVGGLVRLTSASSASSASAQKALNRCPRAPPQHHGQSRPIAGGCHGTTSLAWYLAVTEYPFWRTKMKQTRLDAWTVLNCPELGCFACLPMSMAFGGFVSKRLLIFCAVLLGQEAASGWDKIQTFIRVGKTRKLRIDRWWQMSVKGPWFGR